MLTESSDVLNNVKNQGYNECNRAQAIERLRLFGYSEGSLRERNTSKGTTLSPTEFEVFCKELLENYATEEHLKNYKIEHIVEAKDGVAKLIADDKIYYPEEMIVDRYKQ